MPTRKIIALGLIFLGVGIIVAFGIITLIRQSRPTAGLKVETNPSSVVFVNNEQIGTSPIDKTFKPSEVTIKIIPNSTNQNLSTYQTKVRLSDKVYTVIRRDFGTSDNTSSGETITLVPQSSKEAGLVVATSTPEFASVTLDGEFLGSTLLSKDSVSPGDHQIVISAPGYSTRTISAQAQAGYKLTINAKLAISDTQTDITPTPTATSSGTTITPTVTVTPKISPISLNSTPTPKPSPTLPKPYVQILNTPTGFLRVRSGPGKTFAEVGQIKPKEYYSLLGITGDWYNISAELESTSSGWISKEYAQKFE